ncbi:11651_t:CDS:2, partial [Dentiscutata heterogama]
MDEIHESDSSNDTQSSKKRKFDNLSLPDEDNSISKVWLYFTKDKIQQVGRYKVTVFGKNRYVPCGKEVNFNTAKSTGNFWYHLKSAHGIHKDNIDNVSNVEHNQISLIHKQILNNKIVSFICKDQQPLSVITDDGFIELMKEVVPNYKLPSKKAIKILLSQAFTHTKQHLMDKLSETLFYALRNIVASLQSNHEEFQQTTKSDNSLIARIFQLHHPQIDE